MFSSNFNNHIPFLIKCYFSQTCNNFTKNLLLFTKRVLRENASIYDTLKYKLNLKEKDKVLTYKSFHSGEKSKPRSKQTEQFPHVMKELLIQPPQHKKDKKI